MESNNSKKSRFDGMFFIFLAIFCVSTSGYFTFMGLIEVRDNVDIYMKTGFVLLIFAFICAISYFWIQWQKFITSAEGVRQWVRMLLVSVPVLLLTFGTSSIFNIVCLSGPMVTRQEIQEKLDDLTFFLTQQTVEKGHTIKRIKDSVEKLHAEAVLYRKQELSNYVNIPESLRRGPMYAGYEEVANKTSAILDELEQKSQKLGNERKVKKMFVKLKRCRDFISSRKSFEQRQEMSEQRSDLLVRNSRALIDKVNDLPVGATVLAKRNGDLLQGSPKGFNTSAPLVEPSATKSGFIFGTTDAHAAAVDPDMEPDSELNHMTGNIQHSVSGILKDINSKNKALILDMENHIGHLSSISVATNPSIREMRLAYETMVSDLLEEIEMRQSDGEIQAESFNDLAQFIQYKIQTMPDWARKGNPFGERLHSRYKPFLEHVNKKIQDINTQLKDVNNIELSNEKLSMDLKHIKEYFRLTPVYRAVFKWRYASWPMLSIAILLDFVLIPLLLIKTFSCPTKLNTLI